jgi:SAM-dependent methyltransferase
LKRVLPQLHGRLLDVGCGDKPYREWLRCIDAYVGVDVYDGPEVDVLINPKTPWPVESGAFDSVLCTQVLEHVADIDLVVREIRRVLKPGGMLVVSVPFAYNEHGGPDDYRRLSIYGVRELFAPDYEILEIKTQGRVGSSLTSLLLNWIDGSANQYRPLRVLKGLLLPIWIPACAVVNLLGRLLDAADRTGAFYNNVLLVARKPCA